jgi:hypothetical protein
LEAGRAGAWRRMYVVWVVTDCANRALRRRSLMRKEEEGNSSIEGPNLPFILFPPGLA